MIRIGHESPSCHSQVCALGTRWMLKQAVLLTRFIAPLRLPKRISLPVTQCRFAPLTVAGPCRHIRLLY